MTGPIPTQRDAPTGGTDAMLTYVVGALDNLREITDRGFREVREQLAELPQVYVSQREFDRTRDTLTLELADLRRLREQDERDRAARLEQRDRDERAAEAAAARDRRVDRWQRIGLAVSSALALLGTASGLLLHFT